MNLEDFKILIENKNYSEVDISLKQGSITPKDSENFLMFLYDYTNSFKNSNTTKEIFQIAWKLINIWVNHSKLIIEKTRISEEDLRLYSELIKLIKLYKSDKIAWIITDIKIIQEDRLKNDFIKNFMDDILITISWIDFCFLAVKLLENKFLLFLKSRVWNYDFTLEINWDLSKTIEFMVR